MKAILDALLLNSELEQNQLKLLITHSAKIAFAKLRVRYPTESNKFSHQGTPFQDISTDAIAPLFIKDKSGELPFRKALLNRDKEITDDASAYYFLSKIIGNRIDQEISKKLKEADPFFGKILRSINYVIEKRGYSKTSYFGVSYIVENESAEINQKPPDADYIESLPNGLFHGSNEEILASLFEFIKKETDFFPAIPINALIRRIKHYHSDNLVYSGSNGQNNLDEMLDIENIVNSSLENTIIRLNKFYLDKGKVSKEESEIFKTVLEEYASDLKDGGVSRGLYEYLNVHVIELSKEEFYKKYHQNLDYLIRLLKKGIADKLEKEK